MFKINNPSSYLLEVHKTTSLFFIFPDTHFQADLWGIPQSGCLCSHLKLTVVICMYSYLLSWDLACLFFSLEYFHGIYNLFYWVLRLCSCSYCIVKRNPFAQWIREMMRSFSQEHTATSFKFGALLFPLWLTPFTFFCLVESATT